MSQQEGNDQEVSHDLKSRARQYLLSSPQYMEGIKFKNALWMLIFFRVIILLVVLGISGWIQLGEKHTAQDFVYVYWPIAITLAISVLNALWLRYAKHPHQLGYFQLATDVLLVSLAIYITGSNLVMVLYLLVIVAAAIVFGGHGSVGIAVLSAMCYSLLAAGIIPPMHESYTTSLSSIDIFIAYASLLLVALTTGYLSEKLSYLVDLSDAQQKNISKITKRQEQLFNDISEGIITVDENNEITSINAAAKDLLKLSEEVVSLSVGSGLSSLLSSYGVKGIDEIIASYRTSNKAAELRLEQKDWAATVYASCTVRALKDENEKDLGSVLMLKDISNYRTIEEKLLIHEDFIRKLAHSSSADNSDSDGSCENVKIIGNSPVMKRVFSLIQRVASADVSVMIYGESGTGKELIAKAIHHRGARSEKPFLAINCGAIPESLIESELFGHKKGSFTGADSDKKGFFQQADGGTLFLDEIGELPIQMQTKLLRVLQEKTVRPIGDNRSYDIDVRIISATNRVLKDEIANGNFREDLYYRLNVVNIWLPPLRERREDIPNLVNHFLHQYANDTDDPIKISPEALSLITNYNFPGNIRELENIIERASVLGGNAILPEHLPNEVLNNNPIEGDPARNMISPAGRGESTLSLPVNLDNKLEELEKSYLLKAMDEAKGVKKNAAELLGVNFRSFRYRLKKYNLDQAEQTAETAD